uniref:F-box domain-containing protein n=1 Tax=Caenorhabditis tropicalis TaxID=1561998 RepID=A0A1I7UX82_9PELO
MHLLNFPLLVQERILRQMDYSEVFLLSLVSKMSTKMVRTVNWKEIETIRYFFQPKQRISVTVVRKNGDSSADCILKISSLDEKRDALPTETIRISGVDVCCRAAVGKFDIIEDRFFYKPPVAYYTPNERDTVVWAISFYLASIFGKYSKNGLFVSTHTEPLPTYLENTETELFMNCTVEPSFLNVYFSAISIQDFVEIFNLKVEERSTIQAERRGDGVVIDGQLIRRPFRIVPGEDYVEVPTCRVFKNLNPDSNFYHASTVHIWGSPSLASGMIRHFKGQRAFVDDSDICTIDVIMFLNRWKSNEAFQRLRVFCLKTSQSLNIHQIRDEQELSSELLSGGMDEIPMEERQCTMYPWALNYHLLARRVDGAVAYVSIEQHNFSFYVQNLIDKELMLVED